MNTIQRWMTRPTGERKLASGLLCLLVLGIIAGIDDVADYRVMFTSLYVLPIGFATLYVNRALAIFLAVLSIVLSTGGDVLAGAPSPGMAIRLWNDGIIFSLYAIVIYLLDTLRQTLAGLEATVDNRTRALRREMEDRERLEREILDLSERERQSFGQELHDSVCQELAGTALAGQMLVKKLQDKRLDEAADAKEVTELIYRSLTQARSVARGFFTAGFDATGLADALREAVAHAQKRSGTQCEFRWQDNSPVLDENVVIHFFRIAQEAIQNALKHSGATRIDVSLENRDGGVQLMIEDNGKGLSKSEGFRKGLGLRIMAHRAGLIGAIFKMEKSPAGGTRIVCTVPAGKHPTLPGNSPSA